jgi:hypothetical protein
VVTEALEREGKMVKTPIAMNDTNDTTRPDRWRLSVAVALVERSLDFLLISTPSFESGEHQIVLLELYRSERWPLEAEVG